jgi:ABC-type uncharacterized transport system ATPase component
MGRLQSNLKLEDKLNLMEGVLSGGKRQGSTLVTVGGARFKFKNTAVGTN